MAAVPVRRAWKRGARRPTDSRASLRGAPRRSCRAESSPAGVARSGGNSQCRREGGLWAASATQSVRRPWAHQGMDERHDRPCSSAATSPVRATLTRAPLLERDFGATPTPPTRRIASPSLRQPLRAGQTVAEVPLAVLSLPLSVDHQLPISLVAYERLREWEPAHEP